MISIKLEYSEKLVKQAVLEFWKRTIGVALPIVMVAMFFLFAYLVWSGDRSWLIGVLGSVLAFATFFVGAVYFVHYRNSMQKFRDMKNPSAILELHDEHLTIKSDAGSSELRKTLIVEVWACADFWLVFLSRSQFFTIPKTTLSSTDLDSLKSKFSHWGLKVI